MNLTIDIGNTHTKFGVFEEDILKKVFRLETSLWGSLAAENLIQSIRREFPALVKGILCSVLPLSVEIEQQFQFLRSFRILTSETKIHFTNLYRSKATLGTDRLAAVSGALIAFPTQNCLIVNAGTCITYDFINEYQEYLGGGISPGLSMRNRALNTFTAKLPLVSFDTVSDIKIMGETTEECIKSGILWGAVHEVAGFVHQYFSLYPKLQIILAGGDAKFLDTHLKNTIFAHQIKWMPDLVLIGLNRILKIQDA